MNNSGKSFFKWLCIAVVAVMVAHMVYFMLVDAVYLIGDESKFFIPTTARGKYMPISMNMWRGGRFLPLQMFEFNVLPLLGFRSAFAHHMVPAMEYLASVILAFLLFRKIGDGRIDYCAALPIALLFFYGNDVVREVFIMLYYAERVLTPLLLGFCLFYLKATGGGNHSTRNYLIALILAAYATYCKEPVFGIFWVIAGTNLIFNYKNLSRRDKLFNYALIANGVVYLLLYYFIVYRTTTEFYRVMRWKDIIEYKMLVFFAAFALFRIFCVLFRHDRKNLVFDSLLFGGFAYFVCYVAIMRTAVRYYLWPAYVLSIPVCYYWLAKGFGKFGYKFRAPAVLCLFLVLVYYFVRYPYRIFDYVLNQRENVVEFNGMVSKALENKLNICAPNLSKSVSNVVSNHVDYVFGPGISRGWDMRDGCKFVSAGDIVVIELPVFISKNIDGLEYTNKEVYIFDISLKIYNVVVDFTPSASRR